MNSTTTVKVERIRPIDSNGGNLKAFASVRVGDFVIHDCRVVKQSGQNAWVSLPANSYEDREGRRRWYSLVEVPTALKGEIERAVLEAWEQAGG